MTDTAPSNKALSAALVVAQKAMPNVPNDAKNPHHNYSYTSAEAIFSESRKALLEGGLAFTLTGWDIRTTEGGVVLVDASYLLVHGPSGEREGFSCSFPAIPRKGHDLDKAVSAALTTGEAYLLRGLLLIPRCAESDDVASLRDEEKKEPVKAAAKKADAKLQEAQERLKAKCRDAGITGSQVATYCKAAFAKPFAELAMGELAKLNEWIVEESERRKAVAESEADAA